MDDSDDTKGRDRRRFLALCSTAALSAVSGCTNWGRHESEESSFASDGPSVRLEQVATGLTQPVALETPRTNPDLKYVADKMGQVYVHDSDGLRERPFLDLGEKVQLDHWEMGLVGLELHPDFENNRRFYVRYSAPLRDGMPDDYSHTFVLSEFRARPDLRRAVPDSERVVLEIAQPGPQHNSGAIEFGPDGHLYVGTGDGGPMDAKTEFFEDKGPGHAEDWYGGAHGGNGQDLTQNLHGSILRIDVNDRDDDQPYSIPDDNPLVGAEGLDEQYAWGFRNPYRFSFDRDRLLVGDVGYRDYEEINVVTKGGNYGWNVLEGTKCVNNVQIQKILSNPLLVFDLTYWKNLLVMAGFCPTRTPDGDPLVQPAIAYPHERNGDSFGTAVIGGHVYRGSSVSALQGEYVFGDLMVSNGRSSGGRLFVSTPRFDSEEVWQMREIEVANADGGRLSKAILSFARDADGELYVLTSGFQEGSGDVRRIASA